MEVKQHEIRQDMEQKLRNVQEQTQEKFRKSVKQMQEEYQRKLEQEVQRQASGNYNRERPDCSFAVRKIEGKMVSLRKALETAKQMLHQGRGKTESPEMDWDYYGLHAQAGEQPQQIKGVHNPGRIRVREKNFQKELFLHLWRGNLTL